MCRPMSHWGSRSESASRPVQIVAKGWADGVGTGVGYAGLAPSGCGFGVDVARGADARTASHHLLAMEAR
jgi:hypothetical protein